MLFKTVSLKHKYRRKTELRNKNVQKLLLEIAETFLEGSVCCMLK